MKIDEKLAMFPKVFLFDDTIKRNICLSIRREN